MLFWIRQLPCGEAIPQSSFLTTATTTVKKKTATAATTIKSKNTWHYGFNGGLPSVEGGMIPHTTGRGPDSFGPIAHFGHDPWRLSDR